MAFDPNVHDAEDALADIDPLQPIPEIEPASSRQVIAAPAPIVALPEQFDLPSPGKRRRRSELYGRLIVVNVGSTLAQPSGGLQAPREEEEHPWTVFLQPVSLPVGIPGMPFGTLYAIITYGIGQATFQKIVPLPSTSLVKFTVIASYVSVSFFIGGTSNAISTNNGIDVRPQVNVGFAKGAGYVGPEAYAWQWVPSQTSNAAMLLYTGPGVVGILRAIFKTPAAAGTILWPLFFDLASIAGLAANPSPINGGRLGAIANTGDDRSFTDEQNPGLSNFTTGLVCALSTKPDVYAAAAAGNTITVEAKIGT